MNKLIKKLIKGRFYSSNFDFNVNAKIINVVQMDKNTLYVSFEGGSCSLYLDKIKEVSGPSNFIGVYTWCYELKNSYNKLIGYIGMKELE